MKKNIKVMIVLVLCLSFVSYIYLKPHHTSTEVQEVYKKTVVFKDKENDLIPIHINFYNEIELEQEIRNRIDVMKSESLESYGLYPVFSQKLELLSLQINNHILTLNFNDELYANGDALNIIEALTYTMTDYEQIEKLNIQINDEEVSYIPNSTIPLTSLTQELGLNNFVETSAILHETIPVMVYNEKTIGNYSYYVPTTIRIDENDSLKSQVTTILEYVQSQIHVVDVKKENNILTVELDSHILLDNERLDQTLEKLILLSLSSLKNINEVKIVVDGEDIQTQSVSSIVYNEMKL